MSLEDVGKKMAAVRPIPSVKAWPGKQLTEPGLLFRVHYRRRGPDHELAGRYGVTVASAIIVRECRTTLEDPSRKVKLIGKGVCLMNDHDLVPVSREEYEVAEVMLG
jgi:hypothetical protein